MRASFICERSSVLFHIEHSGNQDEASPPDPEYLTHMHETFLIHVLGPLEAYLRFLNTHRFTISTMTQLNGHYVDLLLILLEACFSHSPTMSFIFSSSIPMTAASLVSASETDQHLWKLVFHYRRKLDTRSNMDGHANKNMNEVICRLGDEGLENELDQHLFTDKAGYQARTTVEEIIQLSNQLGMNIEGV
ncbi:hypothetical protein BLNAU_10422 [Blattamonas nauphoetae]|uniref:Uncharacterized protein n=1 Tax=Blattamonas nauphoetae TaxID=2049346 RepID=A0ABQ9XQZ5_9EUKA|nr:hypothetical protein BLNAU_10422 [Blattamonas nauphoetae]